MGKPLLLGINIMLVLSLSLLIAILHLNADITGIYIFITYSIFQLFNSRNQVESNSTDCIFCGSSSLIKSFQ